MKFFFSLQSVFSRLRQDSRSRMVLINTFASGAMKICSLLCSLIIVPLTIDYLNPENYGLWMAITSILYWFTFMDVGLGNGMRNYLAESFSRNDINKAQSYFSTSMLLLSLLALMIAIVFLPSIFLIDLKFVFNTTIVNDNTLFTVLAIAILLSLMQFIVKNIGLVYIAMQKYAVNDLILFFSNITTLVAIYCLTKITTGNLIYVVFLSTGIPVLAYLIASIFLFYYHPELKPSFDNIDLKIGWKIMTKGLGFFIIQITSCLVVFGSANILISHYCGPEQVTIYNIAYKFFNILIIGYTILISPMWNAYTDAAIKGDFNWIRKAFKNSLALWGLSVVGGIVAFFISDWFFQIWIGGSIKVPTLISLCVLAFVCAFNLNNCATYLINGLNKIRVQIITSIIFTVLFLVAVFVIKGRYGIIGISLTMTTAYLLMAAIHLYQCRFLISQRATGIWNK